MSPVAELERLRGDGIKLDDRRLTGGEHELEIQGHSLDIELEIEPDGAIGLALACAPDGSEETRLSYDPAAQLLSVNRQRTSLSDAQESFNNDAPHELQPGESLQLRILLDSSVLEVIANGRTSICSRIYPTREDSRYLRLFGRGLVKRLRAWQMRSIWPE